MPNKMQYGNFTHYYTVREFECWMQRARTEAAL